MEDSRILDLYFARNEQAIAETDRKYGAYCFSLAKAILDNAADAEEAVNDTYFKTWNVIPPNRPQVLKLFLAKITRNLSFSRWRNLSAQKRGRGEMAPVLEELDSCIPSPVMVEDTVTARELAETIRSFLDTIPPREQDIFLRRYFFVEKVKPLHPTMA